MDTDTYTDRIRQFCTAFKLPMVGTEAVPGSSRRDMARPWKRCWRCWSWKPRTVSSGGPLGCVAPPGWHRVRPGTPSSINGSRPDYNSNWVSWRKGNS